MEESVKSVSSGIAFTFENLISFATGIYKQILPFFDYPLGEYLLAFGLLGLAIMTLVAIKKKSYLYFMLFFYSNILFMYLIEFISRLGLLRIIYLTQLISFFVFVYIGAAFLFSKVILPYLLKIDKKFVYLFYLLIVVFGFYSSYKIYVTYREKQETLNMVQADDLEVFEWMSENIEQDVVVLNNANIGQHRKNIIYASDGGAWIPVFTDFEIAMPFTEFSSEKTHDNYDIYSKIFQEEYSCEDIDILLQRDINYYYHGSKAVFGGQINPGVEEDNFKLVFISGSARLFKLISCEDL